MARLIPLTMMPPGEALEQEARFRKNNPAAAEIEDCGFEIVLRVQPSVVLGRVLSAEAAQILTSSVTTYPDGTRTYLWGSRYADQPDTTLEVPHGT